MKKIIILSFLCVFSITSTIAFVVYRMIFNESEYNSSHILEIEKHEPLNSVINKIINSKISNNKFIVKLLLTHDNNFNKIKYGEFQLKNNISLFEAIKTISKPSNYLHKITIIEGETSEQICNKINDNQYLSGDLIDDIKEGSILPGTYCFCKNIERNKIISIMQNNLQQYLCENINNKSELCHLCSFDEIINLASILEKESSILYEKQIIAYIYLKRLKCGMRLQSCPTALYKTNKLSLLIKDTKIITDHNTYMMKGLPKTPICNPSKESIYAVLHPIESDYLYFLSDGNGRNIFSENFPTHIMKKSNIKKKLKDKH